MTSGFWQAVVISDLTVFTLDGQDAPLLSTIVTTTMIRTSSRAPPPIRYRRCRQRLGWYVLPRPWLSSISVRSGVTGDESPGSVPVPAPPRPPPDGPAAVRTVAPEPGMAGNAAVAAGSPSSFR